MKSAWQANTEIEMPKITDHSIKLAELQANQSRLRTLADDLAFWRRLHRRALERLADACVEANWVREGDRLVPDAALYPHDEHRIEVQL